jgi:hypothetical protein
MTKKARNEAIERVGRALYGLGWVGELKTREWEIGKSNGRNEHCATVALPTSGKSAAKIANACFRSRASIEQYDQVFRWLHEQGVNCGSSGFDVGAFEKWFRKKFPDAPPSTTASRIGVVQGLLLAGRRPGRGGNIRWKRFCDLVRAKWGGRCDDKTIKRDVADLRLKMK